jgi:metallophosphoesterase superfamily enzyme
MKRFWIILLLIFPSAAAPQQFRFAVWGDSQFQNPEVFEETVRRTELLKPEFVIHTGDMIHGYTYSLDNARRQWQRFKKQIEPLSVPFYPTPGNHDVTTKEIQPAYLEAWGDDKLFYSFEHQNSYL